MKEETVNALMQWLRLVPVQNVAEHSARAVLVARLQHEITGEKLPFDVHAPPADEKTQEASSP